MIKELSTFVNIPTIENLSAYLKAVGVDNPERVAKESMKVDRHKVNNILSTCNHFSNLTHAVDFINDALLLGGYPMPEYLWPDLETEKNVRVRIELDKRSYLVICFYKFQSGTIECIAYIS